MVPLIREDRAGHAQVPKHVSGFFRKAAQILRLKTGGDNTFPLPEDSVG